jgi:peptide/nickel transport system substrate-binding protein
VRKALSMAIDRELWWKWAMARRVVRPATWCPPRRIILSDNTDCLTQDMDGAKALLDEAGWTDSDGDGIRDKDGQALSMLYQTSTNAVRQDFQALIKGWWNEIGVEVELKNVDASVFFGGDPGSPDTFQKFYADVEMYANNFDGTDPSPIWRNTSATRSPARRTSGRAKTSTASATRPMTRWWPSLPHRDFEKRAARLPRS